jgi:hypothetical protein
LPRVVNDFGVAKIPHVSTGEWVTRWTVRIALLFYAATLALRLSTAAHRRAGRALWTLGCLTFLAHVLAAFAFYHGWSHAYAYRETARQTRELFSIDWGGGLYLNYLFTLAWMIDAAYWWRAGLDAYDRRPRWVAITLHAFFAFMAFNGAVVFARGATRWIAVAIIVTLALLALLRLRRVRQRRLGRLR